MSLKDKVFEFVSDQVPDKKTKPDNISICTPSECIWDVDNSKDVLIVASWKVDAPDDWHLDERDDRRYVYVDKDNKNLYQLLMNSLMDQYDNISILDNYTELYSLSIEPTPKYNKYDPDWSDDLTEEMYSIMLCSNYHEPNLKDLSFINQLVNKLENMYGESITNNQIQDITVYYSDFHYNQTDTIRYTIKSKNPHFYYSNVNSLDEYIDKKSKDKNQKEKLKSQDRYEVLVVLGRDTDGFENRTVIPDSIIESSENLMRKHINNYISCDSECFTEGESITYDGEVITTKFWIRQNIS